MLYKYRAKKGPDDVVDGTIEANSEKEAIEKISMLGFLPLRLEEGAQAHAASVSSAKGYQGRIGSREITIVSRQLASLLKAGVPILSSLKIIAEQSDSLGVRQVLNSIHDAVKEGATFSSGLSQYPKIFSPLYIAMVRTGENSGVLPEVLFRIAEYRTKQEEALSRFRMALAYPVLMALVGMGTIIFMLTYVMPRLIKIFVTLGQQLPLPTRILIKVSNGLQIWWVWVVVALFMVVAYRQSRTQAARVILSNLSLRLPLLGKFMIKSELARFSSTLELLLRSGIPILKAIDVAIPVVHNEVLKDKLKASYLELEQGGSFGKSLRHAKVFPLFMANLITVGEESGKLSDALTEIAVSYERDTDEATKIMANLLEPLMILGMGLIVGFIVIAMLLPIFEINVMAR
ncbi:MAG: type II secretion system F family protein [Candidatus Omnitrophica bacterium]|nr:type II secretion system F family protein [Candidatus Omnitrophota bacterium]